MDTSEHYIKMCEKAEEIQEIWHSTLDDDGHEFVYCREHNALREYADGGYLWCPQTRCESRYDVWLPRQDQLQEMVNPQHMHGIISFLMVRHFVDWFLNSTKLHHPGYLFTSMEQLWLAFVMKEKHNKTWNSEDWHYY